MKQIGSICLLVLLWGCGASDRDMMEVYDLSPPKLVSSEVVSPEILRLSFDENVSPEVLEDAAFTEYTCHAEGEVLEICLTQPTNPGEPYQVNVSVQDDKKNASSYILAFYGYNPEVPDIVINEFNPRGSDSSPDCIEFFVLSDGLTGGLTLTLGSLEENSGCYIFPNIRVKAGDYLILHCKPQGLVTEVDEHEDKTLSGGLLSHPEAWDLWWSDSPGISGNNGVLALWENPDGNLKDCVVYTDRETDPLDPCHGWTASVFKQLTSLKLGESWRYQGDFPEPGEAVFSAASSATRSIGRSSFSEDTNQPSDWHIVPTGKKSFGWVNSDEVY